MEDKLLTVSTGLIHDGSAPSVDEEMSPTTERLAVYLWLLLIDDHLLAYVSQVYVHDLQTKSLKEIQLQICKAMDSLLLEISAQEDIQVQYSRFLCSNYHKKPFTTRK